MFFGGGRVDARHAARAARAEAVFRSTPTALTQSSTTPVRASHRARFCGHVVLILPHADGLGVDLHQLRQRVLQPPRDGHGASAGSRRYSRELLRGELACGVDRRARLADHHIADARRRPRGSARRPSARSRGWPCRCRWRGAPRGALRMSCATGFVMASFFWRSP